MWVKVKLESALNAGEQWSRDIYPELGTGALERVSGVSKIQEEYSVMPVKTVAMWNSILKRRQKERKHYYE